MDPEFLKFITAYMQSQQNQSSYSPQDRANADLLRLQGLRNDPQGDANHGYVPGLDNSNSPFSNGFFKSMDQRRQIETDRLGTPGFESQSPRQQAGALLTNPTPNYAQNAANASPAPFHVQPSTLDLIQRGPQPRQYPQQTGAQGDVGPAGPAMGNPWAGISSLLNPPATPTMNLGIGQRRKPFRGGASANPQPGFNFPALLR